MTGTAKTPKTAKRANFGKFYRETKAEVKKVSWPSRKELLQHTEVVITSIILIGIFLFGVDTLFGRILDLFITR